MKKEDRKARTKEIMQKIAAMSDDERKALLRKIGIVTIEGRRLSDYNQCFLYFQNPETTVVGGYKQWKAAGRQVRKGEHGMSIYIPCGTKDEEGNIEANYFWFATVFDVSQTDEIGAEAKAEENLEMVS